MEPNQMSDPTPTPDDYSAFIQGNPEQEADKLQTLMRFAGRAVEAQKCVDELEEALKAAKGDLAVLVEKQIPDIMDNLEPPMKSLTLADGTVVEVGDAVRASIPKALIGQAVDWLDEHNLGGIVKRVFEIAFNRDETKLVNKLRADLLKRKVPLRLSIEQWVEPSTLKSLVTKRLEAGQEIPRDLFGVFVQRRAKIKAKKTSESQAGGVGDDF